MRKPSRPAPDDAELRGELGDVLLQVVLHARLAEERGAFTFDDVARGLSAKMVRRNPHVFRPDGTLQDSFPATVEEIVRKWDAVKSAERPERSEPVRGDPGRPACPGQGAEIPGPGRTGRRWPTRGWAQPTRRPSA